MGKRRLAARRKRKTTCPSSDDSGISLEGEADQVNTSCSKIPNSNKNLEMQRKDETSKHASAITEPAKAVAENIIITVQNINKQNDIQPQDGALMNYSNGPVGVNEFSPNIGKNFSFDIEESFLDYEPDDFTAASEKNNVDEYLLDETFEGSNNLNEMQSVNPRNLISDEFTALGEAMSSDEETMDSNYLDQTIQQEIPENNDFLKNANVKFNGTNITIMRPFSVTIPTNIPKPIDQEQIISPNIQTNDKTENSQIPLPLPSPTISTLSKQTDWIDKAWSEMKLDFRNTRITSDDDIFSYTNQQDNEDSNSEFTDRGLDYMSCTSVLDLSDDQAYEIFDNSSMYSESDVMSEARSTTSHNFLSNRQPIPKYQLNEKPRQIRNTPQVIFTPPSVIEEDASERSNFHDSMENNPEFRVQISDKQELVTRWLHSNEVGMEHLLESLCEAYFTSNCENFQCGKSHLRQQQVEERIKQLSPQKLSEIYAQAQGKMFLYIGLFSTFLDCFKVSPSLGRVMLPSMIDDIFVVFNGSFIDKTVYVQKIVVALQDTGLSFKNAIDCIISKYGTSQITLSDILLFIISKEPNLDEHWCIVQILILNRKEKLDHEVVTNFLYSALNFPANKELWTAILNDIVRYNLVVWEKIPRDLLKRIHMVVPIDDLFRRTSSPFVSTNTVSECSVYRRSYEYDEWSEQSAFCDSSTQIRDSPTSSDNNDDLNSEYNEQLNVTRNIDRVSNENRKQLSYALEGPFTKNEESVNTRCSDLECDTMVFNCTNNMYDEQRTISNNVFKVPTECVRKRKRNRSMILGNDGTHDEIRPGSSYSDKVLKKINDTMNPPPRPQTPANIVAHPTRRPLIDSNYQCNISLHNLSPSNIGGIEISQNDLLRLKEALDDMDVEEFLAIFSIYQNSYAIQNFVLHTLTLLKNKNHKIDIFKKFVSLQAGLEKTKPNYMEDDNLKMLIEVLAMNLIYLLEKKGKWDLCRKILLGMKKKDWHSLVTSKIFFCKSRVMSHMCRYIFVIKIFIHAKDFHWANEIFQSDVLKLLEPTSNWPFQYIRSDVNARNELLQLFLAEGLASNFVVVNDLLKHIAIVTKGTIEGIDIWRLFDEKICDMIDSEKKYKLMLQLLCGDLIRYYGPFISKYTLQGYLLHMQNSISDTDAYQLYKYCCDRGLYTKYTGHEYVITVGTRMNDFEINLQLKQFLENISNGSVSPHDFRIELKLSEALPETIGPEILRNKSDRNAFSILASIINILKIKYNIYVQTTEMKIQVSRQMLESLSWK